MQGARGTVPWPPIAHDGSHEHAAPGPHANAPAFVGWAEGLRLARGGQVEVSAPRPDGEAMGA